MSHSRLKSEPYSAIAVANTLLKIAESHGEKLDPMKLQKLIYYAHGWHLAFYDKPLIDEEVQAWPYGPVIESVYHRFKKYGAGAIKKPAKEFDEGVYWIPEVAASDVLVQDLLAEVWRVYGKYTGIQLSNMSHQSGTPWARVWKENKSGLWAIAISNRLIRQHFHSQLEDSTANG